MSLGRSCSKMPKFLSVVRFSMAALVSVSCTMVRKSLALMPPARKRSPAPANSTSRSESIRSNSTATLALSVVGDRRLAFNSAWNALSSRSCFCCDGERSCILLAGEPSGFRNPCSLILRSTRSLAESGADFAPTI